jgi:hypothetical protein
MKHLAPVLGCHKKQHREGYRDGREEWQENNSRVLMPRCTATFTVDSDIPHRVAASLTLNPSSFTYRIACLALDEILDISRSKSSPLSTAATSLIAVRSCALSIGMSLNEDFVRRR